MNVYSAAAASRKIGVTYRILDYWDRTATLCPSAAPAAGSGSKRLYTDLDVAVGSVLARLTRLGAPSPVLRAVADSLRSRPPIEWPTRIYVTRDGTLAIVASGLDDGGWVVPTRASVVAAAA